MTNLLAVVPEFDVSPYTHILPSLEKALISTADLFTLDALDVAKRAQVPTAEVKRLSEALLQDLHGDINADNPPTASVGKATERLKNGRAITEQWKSISSLDDSLDSALGGGIASSCLTEIVGESAAGKTQFLLTLLLSVQLPPPQGLGKSALYISTEAPLQTVRLKQILGAHPALSALPIDERPSLNRIQSTHIHDVEAQEHILRFQVPVAIKKQNIGLLVIDSIAANYRAELDKGKSQKTGVSFAKRSSQLAQLGNLCRGIARDHSIAVVVANQVSDRFASVETAGAAPSFSQISQRSRPDSPPPSLITRSARTNQNLPSEHPVGPQELSTDDPLALDHQQCFFTGWGDDPAVSNFKTPSLGLTWTNQLATRIALLKEPVYEDKVYHPGEEQNISGWKRAVKVVFSTRSAETNMPFEIWEGGIRTTRDQELTET